MNLSIGFITAREEPKFSWFFDSLVAQLHSRDRVEIIVVDTFKESPRRWTQLLGDRLLPETIDGIFHVLPKPTVWSGKHRLTNCDWWSKSNSLNSFICLAKNDFIATIDDRCVVDSGWRDCVREAMASNYCVCGYYEKRSGMRVENGVITDHGVLLGADRRTQHAVPYRTNDVYGGHCALPLEWCLAVNGYAENLCDGLSSEDSVFGITLRNSGYPICYDSRMRIIEDRTPGEIGGGLKRADKGPPGTDQDKSHRIISIIKDKTTSQNSFDIRNLRARIQHGEPMESIMPSASSFDWFDGQPIAEMT